MLKPLEKPFRKTGYCGIILILFSVVLFAVNPLKGGKLPEGFYNPVIAFEFTGTEKEVYDLFRDGSSGSRRGFISSMERGLYIDFFYMCAYTIFLLLFAGVCRRITGSGWFIFSMVIALCVLRADFGENIQLLTILINLQSGGFGSELSLLHTYTWAKWGGLSAFFISLIPFLRISGIFGKIISITALLSAVTGSAAFFFRSVLNEIYTLSIELIFVMLIIYSFTFTCRYPLKKRL